MPSFFRTADPWFHRLPGGGSGFGARRQGKGYLFLSTLSVLWILSGAFTPLPAVEPEQVLEAVSILQESDSRLLVERDGWGRTCIVGSPMAPKGDPDAAVDHWLVSHGAALAIDPANLELLFVTDLHSAPRPGDATVYAYRPFARIPGVGEVEIEGGAVRFLVRRLRPEAATADQYSVTYAAAHTALPPTGGYAPVRVSADEAAKIARAEFGPVSPLEWHSPRLAIVPGATSRERSSLAWHVTATGSLSSDSNERGVWTVRVEPESGRVLEVRSELLGIDVTGTVEAMVSPAPLPDIPTNPPSPYALPRVDVEIVGGAMARTAADGSFNIPHLGSDPVEVRIPLTGEWVSVENDAGPNLAWSTTITPPGAGNLLLDAPGDELARAQLNGYLYTTRAHDFVRSLTATGIPGIDVPIPCNVNLDDTCNANYDPFGEEINFFQSGDGCANSAFSNVISHEYGHFVVDELNLFQGAFGEGFGDVLAMMIEDDPLIGRDFEGLGTVVRDPVGADVQYPCLGGVHFCGQILGAVWWKIREQFGLFSGDQAGLEQARQLFIEWSLITTGGVGSSSAHPQTALEVLAIDDDDGILENGTRNFLQICAAFAEHSIDCPPYPPLIFSFTGERPSQVQPGASTTIGLTVTDATETQIPSTARLQLRPSGAANFIEIDCVEVSPGEYTAVMPPQPCGGAIEFAFSIETTGGGEYSFPLAGMLTPFSAEVFDFFSIEISDDFETESGWVVGSPSDDATTGFWERADPIGTAAAPGADHSDPGSLCFVTGPGTVGGALGADDVDGGATTLLSPLLDLQSGGSYVLSYWRWFSNEVGAAPGSDVLVVEISDDDGGTWVPVETVGPSGLEASGGWFEHEVEIATLIAPTSTMRVRFIASDDGSPSLVEAAIDDFQILERECAQLLAPQFRRGDTNGDFDVAINDVIALLSFMFSTGSLDCVDSADANDSGDLNLADALTILQFLFVGGAPPPPPFDTCGQDPTADSILCDFSPGCL